MTSPLARVVQSDATRRRQFEREMMLDSLAWAPRTMVGLSVSLSKLVIFGLTPVCVVAWLVTR